MEGAVTIKLSPSQGTKQQNTSSRYSVKDCVRTNLLSILMMVGVVLGIAMGVALQVTNVCPSNKEIMYVRLPGELFLQMMKMVMIPVVVSTLITATADVEIRLSGKIGALTLVYYLVTLLIASCLGIFLGLTVQPGRRAEGVENNAQLSESGASSVLTILDILRNMIPDNLIEACFLSKFTVSAPVQDPEPPRSSGNKSGHDEFYANGTKADLDVIETDAVSAFNVVKGGGPNMIGIVAVSLATGCIISYVGESVKPLYSMIVAIRIVSFKFVKLFLWYSPIGIAFLILSEFCEAESLAESVHNLIVFVITAIGGLFFHGFVVLPLLYVIVVRRNPYKFIGNVFPAVLVAFGSESSSVTLPVTIQCLEEKVGVDSRVTRLVASVGAVVNMDGVAFYFSLMTIFLAQLSGIVLNAGQVVSVSIISTAMSIGMGSVPGAQYAYIVMIPTALNLPTENIGLLFLIDWITCRCRTVINILGDCFGAGIVEALSKKDIDKKGPKREADVEDPSSTLLRGRDMV